MKFKQARKLKRYDVIVDQDNNGMVVQETIHIKKGFIAIVTVIAMGIKDKKLRRFDLNPNKKVGVRT